MGTPWQTSALFTHDLVSQIGLVVGAAICIHASWKMEHGSPKPSHKTSARRIAAGAIFMAASFCVTSAPANPGTITTSVLSFVSLALMGVACVYSYLAVASMRPKGARADRSKKDIVQLIRYWRLKSHCLMTTFERAVVALLAFTAAFEARYVAIHDAGSLYMRDLLVCVLLSFLAVHLAYGLHVLHLYLQEKKQPKQPTTVPKPRSETPDGDTVEEIRIPPPRKGGSS